MTAEGILADDEVGIFGVIQEPMEGLDARLAAGLETASAVDCPVSPVGGRRAATAKEPSS